MALTSDAILGLIDLRIEPRPRWSERRAHRIVAREGRVGLVPWESPVPGKQVAQGHNVVSPSGRTLVVPVRDTLDPFSRDPWRHVLTDVAGTWVTELGFPSDPRVGVITVDFAVSADDRALAIVEALPPTGMMLQVLSGPAMRQVVEREFSQFMLMRGNDVGLQWSPDGRFLAATIREPGRTDQSLTVLDGRSLEPVATVSGVRLLGSLSWAPEGDRLTVEHDRRAHVLHLSSQQVTPISWLPNQIWDPPAASTPVVLGMLSGQRVLTMRQTRRRVRVLAVGIDSGESRELASLPITDHDWPVLLECTRQWEDVATGARGSR